MRKWKVSLFALGLVGALAALPAMAQPATGQDNTNNNNNGNNGGRGNRGGRGNFDPAARRQQFTDYIKQQLGATDEEWAAIQPKLQKMLDAEREVRGSRGYSRRRGSDSSTQNQPTDQPQSEVSKASADLRAALANKDTPPADIDAKLKALRDAREKAKAQVAQAQKELKDILTHRQEAILVNMGMLD